MAKILLIYDDYTELNAVQFTLKKVGFDCLGISTEFGTTEQVISFNPDIVVASGRGPKVSTVGVGRRLKDMPRWTGKAILIFPPGNKPKPEDLMKIRMDVVLEAPVETVRLIQVLAKLTNQDDQVLIEKLIKTMAQENIGKDPSFIVSSKPTNETVYVGGSAGENKNSDPNISRSKARTSDNDLTFNVAGVQNPTQEVARIGSFPMPASENPDLGKDKAFGNSAFDDLNRREEARARRRPQFSLKPEGDQRAEPQEDLKNRFAGPLASEPERASLSDFEKQPESETTDHQDLPIDKQEVNWSELENQLFPKNLGKEKRVDTDFGQNALPGQLGISNQEAVLSSFKETLAQSESSDPPQVQEGAENQPLMVPTSPDFAKQVRHAEAGLAGKIKDYREMSGSLSLPKESTLKKTNSRKAQIELMKDWKQVELDKQDGLRREFTKALFKKK